MRQLMVWAVQKTLQSYKKKALVEAVSECLLQGLLKNELETSWYGRPATNNSTVTKQHPQNVELMDTISQVRQYHHRYLFTHLLYCRLQEELSKWQSFEQSQLISKEPIIDEQTNNINDQVISSLQGTTIVPHLQQASHFLTTLPLSSDTLDWSMRIAATFADRSKDFCEDIFRQIFARFFADDAATPPVDPLLVLKALTSKAQQSAGQRRQSAVMSALQSRRKSLAAIVE